MFPTVVIQIALNSIVLYINSPKIQVLSKSSETSEYVSIFHNIEISTTMIIFLNIGCLCV